MAVNVVVKHVDEVLELQLPALTTLGKAVRRIHLSALTLQSSGELKDNLATLTGIPSEFQKLVGRGIAPSTPLDTTLQNVSTKNTIKLMLIGSQPDVIRKVRR